MVAVNVTQAESFTELSNIIAEQTGILDGYYKQAGAPSSGLGIGEGLFPPPVLPQEIARAREILIDATEELQVRAYGPTPFLFRQLMQRVCLVDCSI